MIQYEEQVEFNLDEPFGSYDLFMENDCDHADEPFRFPMVSPFRWLFEICQKQHPGISLNPEVVGGIPHIEGTRLSVTQILSRLYVLGSIKEVAKYYEPYLNEEQIKEAISFTQIFLELAGDPYQHYD